MMSHCDFGLCQPISEPSYHIPTSTYEQYHEAKANKITATKTTHQLQAERGQRKLSKEDALYEDWSTHIAKRKSGMRRFQHYEYIALVIDYTEFFAMLVSLRMSILKHSLGVDVCMH